MRGNVVEALLGAVVLVVAAGFLVFAYSSTEVGSVEGYEVSAKFDRVDGLVVGSDVRLGGIKIGTIVDQTLEPDTYLAIVRMSIDPDIRLPADSSAEIVSDGLLGGRYLSLVPGGAEEMLATGDEIRFTQSPVSLESLIGRRIFSQGEAEAE
ncbi:MAG: outer membrane lipid asymmetry maintenance protein MlaD [Alphaproteobacteria bacterium]|nr:outer membrane lipid asymmetry maintenance protein MlaD [Alphaproteobacteria bacterium]